MGFNSVYRCLQEVFPKVDYRLLKAVAIEHSKDADQAVDVVLSDIIPYLSSPFIGSASPPEHHEVGLKEQMDLLSQQQVIDKADVGPSLQPQSVACSNAMETDQSSGFLHADAAPLVEALNESTVSDFYDANESNQQSCGYTENEEVILLGKTQENCVKIGKNKIVHAASDALLHGGNGYQKPICGSTESEELISWGTHEESDLKIRSDAEPPGMPISLISEKDGVSGIVNGLDHECEDLLLPLADESNTLNNHEAGLCLDSTEVRNYVSHFGPTPINRHTPVTSSSPDATSNQANFTFEINDIVAEPEMDTTDTRSGQECKIHLLEEMIEDAKNNKKTLFSAMERVINMMREVELQEKAAEQAKEEASRGGLDILVKVEEMKQMLVHAKEANDMHAGEVYGEKAILATEVRELQSRLLCLSDERDKSLAILDEMHETLEARLATAKDLMEAADQERLEKEESARNALFEQQAVMEKVVEESEMLEQEAEENSRLREFLMNRGRTVDILQGEISVICQDVRLLKEKFDDRVPLSKSVSSTSCILATSGSSGKSMASDLVPQQRSLASSGSSVKSVGPDLVPDRSLPSSGSSPKSVAPVLVPEQGESLKTPKSMSPSPSVDRLSSEGRFEEEGARADRQALLDEGWEFFDKDSELVC